MTLAFLSTRTPSWRPGELQGDMSEISSSAPSRVDGRVLNFLTVDDLFHLKVTNQLHHLSIKHGIQVG